MSARTLRIGTRGSALAMTQARHMAARLNELGHTSEIVVVRTTGDADQVRPFAEVGAPGVFVRELESALQEERVDLAVHCYKDLPSLSPDDLVVAAMPEREDPRDRLLVAEAAHDADAPGLPLREGARVGTASARRRALVQDLRPDLVCENLRGNVPTRIDKLRAGEHDAIVLASAGLLRLERAARLGEGPALERDGLVELDLPPESFVPAPSQGALALQVREADDQLRSLLVALDDSAGHRAVRVERELLARVEAGCQAPFGAWCRQTTGGELELFGVLEVAGELRRWNGVGADDALAREAADLLLTGRPR